MQESSAVPAPSPNGVELDPEQLSPGALRGLIEEFVTREGTDYGPGGPGGPVGSREAARDQSASRGSVDVEWSLEDKVAQVYRQLSSGEARIVFDLELESASIVSTRDG